jgi:hypothetical protein
MWLCEAVCRKWPQLWPNDWVLHHDNAPAYKVLSVKQFLAQKSITKMEYPPCSPDFDLNDFWLFQKLNSALKGRKFQDNDFQKKNVIMALKAIPQQEFQKYFQQWHHH